MPDLARCPAAICYDLILQKWKSALTEDVRWHRRGSESHGVGCLFSSTVGKIMAVDRAHGSIANGGVSNGKGDEAESSEAEIEISETESGET